MEKEYVNKEFCLQKKKKKKRLKMSPAVKLTEKKKKCLDSPIFPKSLPFTMWLFHFSHQECNLFSYHWNLSCPLISPWSIGWGLASKSRPYEVLHTSTLLACTMRTSLSWLPGGWETSKARQLIQDHPAWTKSQTWKWPPAMMRRVAKISRITESTHRVMSESNCLLFYATEVSWLFIYMA